MIYDRPAVEEPIDQGDLIDGCPVLRSVALPSDLRNAEQVNLDLRRVIVLTQTCDLANQKTVEANVAEVFDAQFLVDKGTLKPAAIKGEIRAGRVWGWYFLPADAKLGLPEMIVDLRRLHTIRLDLPGRSTQSAHAAALSRTSRQAFRRYVQPHRLAAAV